MAAADEAEALTLFTGIGLEETTAKNASVNPKFRTTLATIIHEAKLEGGCSKSKGNLLYYLASKYPANALTHRSAVLECIADERIKSNAQLDGAFEYLKKLGSQPLNKSALEASAGVGVVVTDAEIQAAVSAAIAKDKDRLVKERYHFNINILLGPLTKALRWAEGARVKSELEKQWAALLGPRTAEDDKPVEKKRKPAASKPAQEVAKADKAEAAPAQPAMPEDPFAFLPKPDTNNIVHTTVNFSDGKVWRIANHPEKLAAHLKETGGKVITRFPPEPNGYLHIGHAKAMFVDFGMAVQYGGHCYLRYDDTNPEAEKQEYIDHIQEIAAWMGWKPWKITYSSDYFDQLYEFALALIKTGNAYVCHQTKDEIEECREKKLPSPWRDRPMAESLAVFEDMRRGLIDEGKATLRMRMDHKNENVNMFDLIAYRIKFVEHPHAGDKWCIYPSYDYTHCLVDSLENITHSLCTLEFESRRASYYWLLEVLDLYKPLVWEYARLNLTNTVMSKRKLNKLVMGKFVNGWDDPRLPTLAGLRRRGMTPQAINQFCRDNGLTRNDSVVHMHRLEHYIRLDLDATSPRTLAVLRPLKVVITNLPAEHYEEVTAQTFPGRSNSATYTLPFTRVLYIEQTDFKEVDQKDYYGLAPNKVVMLRYAYPITCRGFKKDPSGQVIELEAEYEPNFQGKKPPKGVLSWVAQPRPGVEPLSMEVRLYDYLFTSEDPGSSDAWLDELNPDSLQVVKGAMGSTVLSKAKPGERFQLERLGYFAVDPDSSAQRLVLNRTVTLKESFPKFTKK